MISWRTVALILGVIAAAGAILTGTQYGFDSRGIADESRRTADQSRRTSAQTRVLAQRVEALARQAAEDARVTVKSLCALRADFKKRVATSEDFLKDHPEGFAGIPAATIRSTVDGQKRTIRALGGLRCPKSVGL